MRVMSYSVSKILLFVAADPSVDHVLFLFFFLTICLKHLAKKILYNR